MFKNKSPIDYHNNNMIMNSLLNRSKRSCKDRGQTKFQ